jgi:hypothetical protein
MRKCGCKPNCTAGVKGKGKYAQGHAPAGHVMSPERRAAISEGRKRYFRRGGKVWWEGKHHSEATVKKMKAYAKHRPEEHRRKLEDVLRDKNPLWLKHIAEVNRKRNATNPPHLGFEHTPEARRKMGRTRKQRIKDGEIVIWNKGKKGVQIGWAKGLTKEIDERVAHVADSLLGHSVSGATKKKMSRKAKLRATPKAMKRVAKLRLAKWAKTGNPRKGKSNWWCIGKKNPIFKQDHTRFKHIRYRGGWYRNSYEVAFAKWCWKNKVKYQYEPRTFRLAPGTGKSNTYTPDFLLIESGVYVDTKGYLRPKDFEKMREFKRLYPNERLVLMGKEMLQAVGAFLVGWEKSCEA